MAIRQFITIEADGVSYQIPDSWITAKIHGEYKDLPPFKAFGCAIGDWISSERAKGEAEVTHENAS